MRWSHGPDRTPQSQRASIAVSAGPRRTTRVTRSFSSRLRRRLQHHRHTCAPVTCRVAVGLRKGRSRRPVNTRKTIHYPALQLSPLLPQFKTHSSKIPSRLPSSRCIKSEPAWEFTQFPQQHLCRFASDTTLRLEANYRSKEEVVPNSGYRRRPIKVALGEIAGRYLLVSTAARYRSSDSTSAGSATVSAISWRKSSRYRLRSL
jgi:hypothetical protein